MAIGTFKTEKEFLITLAVKKFNAQYKRNIQPDACNIKSIPPHYRCTHGYEIDTIRSDDYLRMRLYFSFTSVDEFRPYRLEIQDGLKVVNALGDEVYVSVGTLSNYWIDSGMYKFRWIGEDPGAYNYLLDMNGEIMEWVEGGSVQFVE